MSRDLRSQKGRIRASEKATLTPPPNANTRTQTPTLTILHTKKRATIMKYQLAPVSYQQPCQQQQYQQLHQQQHYLTIEDIKSTRNSCWLCGCNWLEDHVSLDCPECGGYALTRPCPNCDGKCQQRWTRNISATHDRHKALWSGQCKFQQQT